MNRKIDFFQPMESQLSSATLMDIAEKAKTEFIAIVTKPTELDLGEGALERLARVAADSGAAMVYADRYVQP